MDSSHKGPVLWKEHYFQFIQIKFITWYFSYFISTLYGMAPLYLCFHSIVQHGYPDSHGANMGPTWVLSAPDGPHVGPRNLAITVALTHAVRCFFKKVYQNMSGEWQAQDINQTMKSQQTFHTSPSQERYGLSLTDILQKKRPVANMLLCTFCCCLLCPFLNVCISCNTSLSFLRWVSQSLTPMASVTMGKIQVRLKITSS